ncbi:hypothetical protein DL96DRAFT_596365 [Flagelloscypha sp. PMI_526]|nr:hypothetical protein DL96DRAFT_596365 [Flagelloscypha sp. PMI_526]
MEGLEGQLSTAPNEPSNYPVHEQVDHLVTHSVCVVLRIYDPRHPLVESAVKLQWRVNFYPFPNKKSLLPQEPLEFTYANELGVQIKVWESRQPSVLTHTMFSRFGFLHPQISSHYFASQLVAYDNALPDVRLTSMASKQRQVQGGLQVGLAGGKPTAVVSAQVIRSVVQGGEASQNDINPNWIVEDHGPVPPTSGSFYEQVAIRPNASSFYNHIPTPGKPPLKATYGMTLDARNSPGPYGPAFKHVSQVHAWVGSDQPRGVIFVFVHYLENACTTEPSWVTGNIPIRLESGGGSNVNNRPNLVQPEHDPSSLLMLTSAEEKFGVASAILPEPSSKTKSSWTRKFLHPNQTKKGANEAHVVQMQGVTARGWDHTNQQWLEFHCPTLDKDMDVRGKAVYQLKSPGDTASPVLQTSVQ